MAVARFKDLCIDANDPATFGPFWAGVLGRIWEPDDDGEGHITEGHITEGHITGASSSHTVWVNRVPEPKSVKHRIHLDIYTVDLSSLEALGSARAQGYPEDKPWTVMVDPEGGEYCAFLRDAGTLPDERLHGLVLDSGDPAAQARWWAAVYGAEVTDHAAGYSTVSGVPGMPITTMDFVPVEEPKAVKNRVHWDVIVVDVADLVDAGATVLRPPGDDRRWHVMADPEGNEFCAFPASRPSASDLPH